MKTRHPAFWRYTAFQIPGWLVAAGGGWWLHTTMDVPVWVASGVLVVWVIKDYAMFPVLRFAYEADDRARIEHLIGCEGTAIDPLDPTGYVRVRGELWQARLETAGADGPVTPRTLVTVTAVEGTTLLVAARYPGRAR